MILPRGNLANVWGHKGSGEESLTQGLRGDRRENMKLGVDSTSDILSAREIILGEISVYTVIC